MGKHDKTEVLTATINEDEYLMERVKTLAKENAALRAQLAKKEQDYQLLARMYEKSSNTTDDIVAQKDVEIKRLKDALIRALLREEF